MDYGALIREAWATTWRHRFLWILGFFAGGAAGFTGTRGTGVQWKGDIDGLERTAPALSRAGQDVAAWLQGNLGMILALVGLAALLGLAMLVVSLIAQGGMAEATVDLARGRSSSFGRAWRTGLRLFWRYVGLWLTLIGLAILVAAVIGAIVAAAIALANLGGGGTLLAVVAGVLLGLPLALGAIVVAIGASIVVAYAQRAIFAEDAGPVAALWSGVRLLREHPGTSALVWLINLALGIGAGIAALLAVVAVLFVLALPGVGFWALAGFTGPTIVYGGLAILAVVAAGIVLSGIANTFLWNYWTLAYLQLTGRRGATAAV
jgi:hypothetical protein